MKYVFPLLLFALPSCVPEKQVEEDWNKTDSLAIVFIPEILTKMGPLEQSLIDQDLVNIQEIDSTLLVDLKYSTLDNFFEQDVYGDLENAYLPDFVAEKLKKASGFLKEDFPDLRLIVYDAVRPHSVQKILWDALDSIPVNNRKAFVADPELGSLHNYGCAVDLSIFSLSSDSVLDMGTKYDYFGHLAYPRKEMEMLQKGLLTEVQIANRELLRTAMKSAGFTPINSEWWHFNSTTLLNAKQNFNLIE